VTTPQSFRATITALMHATGETQAQLATGLRLSQGQISRKQSGRHEWSLSDLDKVAAHYGIAVWDLVAGPDVALSKLPESRRRESDMRPGHIRGRGPLPALPGACHV
jgi:transcriptional regulator with XRE-family HTH domain